MPPPSSVLFLKDFRGLTGGHLKSWHYFEYLDADPGFEPVVRLLRKRKSVAHQNPWATLSSSYLVGRRFRPDVLVLDGLEWNFVPRRQRAHPRQPVVNLLQSPRHASSSNPRYAFLVHPAIRVCVSQEVADAVEATGRANGPIVTIPAATDVDPDVEPRAREVDVLVAAGKAPDLGHRIAARLASPDRRVELLDRLIPRERFLDRLRSAAVAVLLPQREEGCFLPALEAMALGPVVVCPDCVGNRSFCIDGVTCFRPEYDEEAIVAASLQALALREGAEPLRERAWQMARERRREPEAEAVRDLFSRIDKLWAEVVR